MMAGHLRITRYAEMAVRHSAKQKRVMLLDDKALHGAIAAFDVKLDSGHGESVR